MDDLAASKALGYVHDELEAHITRKEQSLGQMRILRALAALIGGMQTNAPAADLSARITTILETLTRIEEAALAQVQTAQAQVRTAHETTAAIAKKLEKERAGGGKSRMTSLIPVSDVEAELKRRATERVITMDIQVSVEDELDELEGKKRVLSAKIESGQTDDPEGARVEMVFVKKRIEALNETITHMREAKKQDEAEVRTLRNYLEAVALVNKGLPMELLRKELPPKEQPVPEPRAEKK